MRQGRVGFGLIGLILVRVTHLAGGNSGSSALGGLQKETGADGALVLVQTEQDDRGTGAVDANLVGPLRFHEG